MTRSKLHPTNTLSTQVFTALREDLLNGHYPAGDKIGITQLRDRYQVGLSPLREALNRLAATGLLNLESQRGFRVPRLCAEELEDIVQLRIELEGMAVTRSLKLGDADWEAELLAAGHRLKQASGDGMKLSDWEVLHAQFHSVLLSRCQSPWMLRFIRQLHEQFDRYRRQAPRQPKVRAALDQQHDDMVQLALKRDIAGMRDLVEAHIRLSNEVASRSCG